MAVRLSHGQKVGAYTIVRLIGSGGEGDIYEARPAPGERRALKQLNFCATDPAQRANLERALRLKRLVGKRSPYVCEIFDVFVADSLVYVAMELVEGRNLNEELKRVGKLSLGDIVRITEAVLAAVGWLHTHGIIHLLLSPQDANPAGRLRGGASSVPACVHECV